MNVTLRQLRAFVCVYRARSITRAALDLAEARAGRVAFLASAGAASALMPRVLAGFRTAYPDIEIDMRDVAADDLVPRTIATDAEFAIGSVEGEIAEMKIEALVSGRLSAIGRRTAEFAARRSLTWDELARQPTIAMRRETRIRIQIDQALSRQSKRLIPTYEVTLINTALAMTAQGLGLAILPATMLPADQFPMLIAKPLTRPVITRQVSLLQRTGRTLSPAAKAFVAIARAVLALNPERGLL
jgi:DNA-binding transcriptional LysR family regulator